MKTNTCTSRYSFPMQWFRTCTYWIQHEAIHPIPNGQDYHGGATVEGIPRSHKLPPTLKGILLCGRPIIFLHGKFEKKNNFKTIQTHSTLIMQQFYIKTTGQSTGPKFCLYLSLERGMGLCLNKINLFCLLYTWLQVWLKITQ